MSQGFKIQDLIRQGILNWQPSDNPSTAADKAAGASKPSLDVFDLASPQSLSTYQFNPAGTALFRAAAPLKKAPASKTASNDWLVALAEAFSKTHDITADVNYLSMSGNVPGKPEANLNNPRSVRRPESWPISSKEFPKDSLSIKPETHVRISFWIHEGKVVFATMHYEEESLRYFLPGVLGHANIDCMTFALSPPKVTYDHSFSDANPILKMQGGRTYQRCPDFSQKEELLKKANSFRAPGEKNQDGGLLFVTARETGMDHLINNKSGFTPIGKSLWNHTVTLAGRLGDIGLAHYYGVREGTIPVDIHDNMLFFFSKYPGEKPIPDYYYNPNIQYVDEFGKVHDIPTEDNELKALNVDRKKKGLYLIPKNLGMPVDFTGIELANDPKRMAEIADAYRTQGRFDLKFKGGEEYDFPIGKLKLLEDADITLEAKYKTIKVKINGKEELRSSLVPTLRIENLVLGETDLHIGDFHLRVQKNGKLKLQSLEVALPFKQKYATGSKVGIADFFDIDLNGFSFEAFGASGEKFELGHKNQKLTLNVAKGNVDSLIVKSDDKKVQATLSTLSGEGVKLNHPSGEFSVKAGTLTNIVASSRHNLEEINVGIDSIQAEGAFAVEVANTENPNVKPFKMHGRGSSLTKNFKIQRKVTDSGTQSKLSFKVQGTIEHAELPGTPAGDISWGMLEAGQDHKMAGSVNVRLFEPKDSAQATHLKYRLNLDKLDYAQFHIANSPQGVEMEEGHSWLRKGKAVLGNDQVFFEGQANLEFKKLGGFQIPGMSLENYEGFKLSGPLKINILPQLYSLRSYVAGEPLIANATLKNLRYRFSSKFVDAQARISSAKAWLEIHKIKYHLNTDGKTDGELEIEADKNIISDIHGQGKVVFKPGKPFKNIPFEIPLSESPQDYGHHQEVQKALLGHLDAAEKAKFCDAKGYCGNFIRLEQVSTQPNLNHGRYKISGVTFYINHNDRFIAMGIPLLLLNQKGAPERSSPSDRILLRLEAKKESGAGAGTISLNNSNKYIPPKLKIRLESQEDSSELTDQEISFLEDVWQNPGQWMKWLH